MNKSGLIVLIIMTDYHSHTLKAKKKVLKDPHRSFIFLISNIALG